MRHSASLASGVDIHMIRQRTAALIASATVAHAAAMTMRRHFIYRNDVRLFATIIADSSNCEPRTCTSHKWDAS